LWRQPLLVLVWLLLFWLYYERIIYAEEQFLAQKFGTQFTVWAQRTPLFVPRPWRWRPPEQPFNWRQAIKREYSSVYALISAFTAFEVISTLVVEGRLEFDDHLWLAIFAGATGFYLLVRFCKKRRYL